MTFKKKHVFSFSAFVIILFIIYQLKLFYSMPLFDLTSSPEDIPSKLESDSNHLKTYEDLNINSNGVIRGIFIKHVIKYRPDKMNMFKCLTSDQMIPFKYMNDDYCDCEDQSDEPSTSACPNGVFYCDTQFTNKLASVNTVPSNRVNDGICDCCDGSDEWISTHVLMHKSLKTHVNFANHCPNTCSQVRH